MDIFCVHCQHLHSDPIQSRLCHSSEPHLEGDFANSVGLSVWSLIWPSHVNTHLLKPSLAPYTTSLGILLMFCHFHFPGCPGKFDRALIMVFELQISISAENFCLLSGCTHSYQLKKHDVNYEIDQETGKLGSCMK